MIKRSIPIAVAALSAAVAGGLLTAVPAQAQAPVMDQGKVIANGGLTVRHLPTTASAATGSLRRGQTVEIVCKVRGSRVDGNTLWYALPPTLNEWVSARYVQNIGAAPRWCGSRERFVGRTTAVLNKRVAPTTSAATAGTLARGAGVDIICKLEGQNVAGNNRWYYLTNGRWVAARSVENVGRAPRWCN